MNIIPKLSIIVPTFNRANYLKETLNSILNQSYQDYEIIITDNASTDNTTEVVNLFKDQRIRYFRSDQNFGIVTNHNKALKLCRGEYIHIFSDDDLMLNNCLLDKVTILENYPSVGIVHSDSNTINDVSEIVSSQHWFNTYWKDFKKLHATSKFFSRKDYHYYLFRIGNLIYMPSVMIRKSAIEKVGYMNVNLKYLLDWDYWLKITLFYDVYYINKKLISYRIHKKRTTTEMSNKAFNEELNLIKSDLKVSFPEFAYLKNTWWFSNMQELNFYRDNNYLRIFIGIVKKSIKTLLRKFT